MKRSLICESSCDPPRHTGEGRYPLPTQIPASRRDDGNCQLACRSNVRLRRPHHLCGGGDRLDYVDIASAAAQHRGNAFADLVLGRSGVGREKIECGNQHPRRAIPALESVVLVKSLLQWVIFVAFGQALDGQQLRTLRLNREHQTRASSLAVEQDRAGATDPVLAADMSAGQPKILADKVDEQFARLASPFIALPVDGQADLADLGHRIDLSSSGPNSPHDGATRQYTGQMAAVFRRAV